MARDVTDAEPVNGRRDLVAWFESGCKAPEHFKVGSEHEKIPFYVSDLSPVPYEGENGIGALLASMRARLGWDAIEDDGRLIGLFDARGGGAISLEPGGQFELSGAQAADIHALSAELTAHLEAAHASAAPLGIGFLGLGMSPKWTSAQTPRMPKSRYRIMASYMPKVGTRGLDMMFRTATAQANLDFSS
jgi:glutamate--cysteine ligase